MRPLQWNPTPYRKHEADEIADTARDLKEWRGRFRIRPWRGTDLTMRYDLLFNSIPVPGSPFESADLAKQNAQARVDDEGRSMSGS